MTRDSEKQIIGVVDTPAPAYIPIYGDPGTAAIGRPIGYTQI